MVHAKLYVALETANLRVVVSEDVNSVKYHEYHVIVKCVKYH